MQYAESVVDLVGNTPLVRLTSVTRDLGPDAPLVLAKLEYLNPGGSVKDRIAVRMVDAAEASGALQPGGTIVEPTSGNTGIGLALVAQQRGYKCIFVCPDKVGQEKINVLRAYGARGRGLPDRRRPVRPALLLLGVRPAGPGDAGRLEARPVLQPGEPPVALRDHRARRSGRRPRAGSPRFVTGMGTGGTISGIGRYLKEASGGQVRVVGADPEGSVYSGGTGRPYLVEGVGEDFWPATYDREIADEIIAGVRRRLLRHDPAAGPRGGAAGRRLLRDGRRRGPAGGARSSTKDDVVVVLLPDGGRGYLNKIFSDEWMADYGFLRRRRPARPSARCCTPRAARRPTLVHTHPNETVREAIDILREYGVSQLPVVRAEPPVTAAEVVGRSTRALLDALFAGRAHARRPGREAHVARRCRSSARASR